MEQHGSLLWQLVLVASLQGSWVPLLEVWLVVDCPKVFLV